MKKRVLLVAIMVAMTVAFTVPSAAQVDGQEPNAECFFDLAPEQFTGYFCFVGEEAPPEILLCPTEGDTAMEGDVLVCENDQGELFDCLVLEVLTGEPTTILSAFCTSAEEGGDGGGGAGGNGGAGGGGGAGGATPITQEGEQESEAGEIDQSFDVS